MLAYHEIALRVKGLDRDLASAFGGALPGGGSGRPAASTLLPGMAEAIRQLLWAHHLNLAQCYLRVAAAAEPPAGVPVAAGAAAAGSAGLPDASIKRLEACIVRCDEALGQGGGDPAKARFLRARARLRLGGRHLDVAVAELEALAAEMPADRALRAELQSAKKALAAAEAEQRKAFGGKLFG